MVGNSLRDLDILGLSLCLEGRVPCVAVQTYICSPTQRGVESKRSLLRQVPRVPGSHSACGEGSALGS